MSEEELRELLAEMYWAYDAADVIGFMPDKGLQKRVRKALKWPEPKPFKSKVRLVIRGVDDE